MLKMRQRPIVQRRHSMKVTPMRAQGHFLKAGLGLFGIRSLFMKCITGINN